MDGKRIRRKRRRGVCIKMEKTRKEQDKQGVEN
jgi:hypothetical protein